MLSILLLAKYCTITILRRLILLLNISDISDKIIKDRNHKIDKYEKDALSGLKHECFVDEVCKVVLDKKTEETIEKLFEREEKIFNIKPI